MGFAIPWGWILLASHSGIWSFLGMLSHIITSVGRIVDITRQLWRGVGDAARRQLMPQGLQAHVFTRITTIEKRLMALVSRIVLRGFPQPAATRARAPLKVPAAPGVPGAPGAPRAPGGAPGVPGVPAVRPLWGVTDANPCGSPRSFGWVLLMAPGHTGTARAYLERVLDEPGMTELLAGSREAERLVRSLCWMLGIKFSDIGHNARCAVIRGMAAWQGPAPVGLDERLVDEAWDLIWAWKEPAASVGVFLDFGGWRAR